MSKSLVFSVRMHYLRASDPKSEGGDAPEYFANEELLPMVLIYSMKREWRRTKKDQQKTRS